jgi:hypothetical protein
MTLTKSLNNVVAPLTPEERELMLIAMRDRVGYMNARLKAFRNIQRLVGEKYLEYYDHAIWEGKTELEAKAIALSVANVERYQKEKTLDAQTIYMYHNHNDDTIP